MKIRKICNICIHTCYEKEHNVAHFPDQEVVKQTSQFWEVGFFCIEIGSTKHYLSPFLPFDLQHKISGAKLSWNLMNFFSFFSCTKNYHIPPLLALQNTKNSRNIGEQKTYPLHLSLQRTKKQRQLWKTKYFSQKLSSASLNLLSLLSPTSP